MRVLICDDDAQLRTVLRTVVADRGHEVVGEAETAADAYDVLARTKPDAAIIDLALRVGSGREVARRAAERGCRVIVFSAFLDDVDPHTLGVIAVPKPDFAALESALDALAARGSDEERWRKGNADRRATTISPDRPMPNSPVEDPSDFYQALGDARPGDSIMFIDVSPTTADATATFAITVRGVIRAHDHLMRRGDQLVALLVEGLPEAATAVAARLERASGAASPTVTWTWRHTLIEADESPADAFQRLRSVG